jgi:hypothetical protein
MQRLDEWADEGLQSAEAEVLSKLATARQSLEALQRQIERVQATSERASHYLKVWESSEAR